MTKIRILLAHNSLYFPSHGGGDKSNRLLMEALAARGNAAEALLVYDRLRTVLHGELGVAPSREVQEVHRRLLGA